VDRERTVEFTRLTLSLLVYLPRCSNHIDLKANAELYVRVPAWLAGRLERRPEDPVDREADAPQA